MHHYHNLLYVSHATSEEMESLRHAIRLAKNNNAPLKILILSPEFPKEFPEYLKKYEESLFQQVRDSIALTKKTLQLEQNSIDIDIELVSSKTPAITIIQHVLEYQYDLIIKEAEKLDSRNGFMALDMVLLRKCPVPVWLCKPINKSHQHTKVAVAIDPETHDSRAAMLAKRLLTLSRSVAENYSGELHIISCWDYEFAGYLSRNSWVKLSDKEIENIVANVEREHYQALQNLVAESKISGQQSLHHMQGSPGELIPKFIEENEIDILVMGTVARTGISGFLIGNTAENITQKLTCSLMALKPQGFVSPVRID